MLRKYFSIVSLFLVFVAILASAFFVYFGCGTIVNNTPSASAPVLLAITPVHDEGGVAVDSAIVAYFDQAMDVSSYTSSFTLVPSGSSTALNGTFYQHTLTPEAISFNPATNLQANKTYQATITTNVKSAANEALSQAFTWTFTTSSAADTTPPSVVSIFPIDASLEGSAAYKNTAIRVEFSEPIDVNTISYLLDRNDYPKNGRIVVQSSSNYSGSSNALIVYPTTSLTPYSNLTPAVYMLTISQNIEDLAGNKMGSDLSQTLIASSSADSLAPTIVSFTPPQGSTGVDINPTIKVIFSEQMDDTSVQLDNIYLQDNTGARVPGLTTYDKNTRTVTFSYNDNLDYMTYYTFVVKRQCRDLAGNLLTIGDSSVFLTVANPSPGSTTTTSILSSTTTNPSPESTTTTSILSSTTTVPSPGSTTTTSILSSTTTVPSPGSTTTTSILSSTTTTTISSAAWDEANDSANFQQSEYHASCFIDSKLWIIGGLNSEGEIIDQVWSSSNGIDWTEVAVGAFAQRYGHAVAVLNDKIYVVGGQTPSGLASDVWFSSDGENWTQVSAGADFSARRFHTLVSDGTKLYLIGGEGGGGSPLRDVWSSTDGQVWEEVASEADFGTRANHASVNFANKLWVMGGQRGSSDYLSDVWFSEDGGANWEQASINAFSGRAGFTAVTADSKIWILGGSNDEGFLGDVFISSNGIAWDEAPETVDWAPRDAHTLVSSGTDLWLMGGDVGTLKNDVWTLNLE